MSKPLWRISGYALAGALVIGTGWGAAEHLGLAQPPTTPMPEASPSQSPSASPSPEPTATTSRIVYQAFLNPLNGSSATANVVVVVDGNTAGIFLQASGLDSGVSHPQQVRAGTACPTFDNDTNNDGIIDETETLASPAGDSIVPLVVNLSTEGVRPTGNEQADQFPVPAEDGNLTYIGSIALSSIAPLPSPSPSANPSPNPSVSPSETPSASPTMMPGATPVETPNPLASALEGRVIMIQGMTPDAGLPSTVAAGNSGLPNWQTVPVACGTLESVNE